jgi:hypothetical protein
MYIFPVLAPWLICSGFIDGHHVTTTWAECWDDLYTDSHRLSATVFTWSAWSIQKDIGLQFLL